MSSGSVGGLSHPRRESSAAHSEDDDHGDGDEGDLIPLLSFSTPAPSGGIGGHGASSSSRDPVASALPPSYEDALELGPASASDHHPPVRLRSLYRPNRAGSSKWRELKEHLGSLHHLLPEPIMACVGASASTLGQVLRGLGRRFWMVLTCACVPFQQRLSLAFAFISLITVLLVIAQPWMDSSGLGQAGLSPEEIDAAITQPELILGVGERVATKATWHWRRCSSEGEALRWQRRTYCTSTASFSFSMPTQAQSNASTLEILFDRVSLETDGIAASGKIPPGGTSSGTAPGKVEVVVDSNGKHVRYANQIRVELLAKYDEDAQSLLEKSTVVATAISLPTPGTVHRLRILTPTLPDIFRHDFNNVLFPHAPLQFSIRVWIPSIAQLQAHGTNARQALPRLRIATAVADVALLRFGSGEAADHDMDGYEEEDFALRGRNSDHIRALRRAPASSQTLPPSIAAFFPSVQVSTLSGRIGTGDRTALGARHLVELRTHFPRTGVYEDAVMRAGRERGNRLSSFGALRAGRGRGQIDLHGGVIVGPIDEETFLQVTDESSAPSEGLIKLATTYSTDSLVTVYGQTTLVAADLQIESDPAGVYLKKGAKVIKGHMIVKGPIKHE